MTGGKLISLSIVLLVTFLIEICFAFRSNVFIRELILFVIFFVGAVVFLFGLNKRWGAPWFVVFFALQILNFVYLHNNMTVNQYPGWLAIALFFSALGLLISVASIKKKSREMPKPEVVDIPKQTKKTAKKTKKK